MQPPKATTSPNVQYMNSATLPNLKLTKNFNCHIDDHRNFGCVDAFQSQEIANNILSKKVVGMKKTPMLISSNIEQQHFDLNNNLNPPVPSVIETLMPPTLYQKHFPVHPLSPLNINTQFHPPQYVNHLNWKHPQFQ